MNEIKIENMIGPSETIMWKGHPDKKCFIMESIFNPMLFFSLIWLLFDLTFISALINSMMPSPDADVPNPGITDFLPYILFFSIHLMPVWIYLGGIIGSIINHKKETFLLTDKAVYIYHGGLGSTIMRIEYRDIEYISFKRGLFDNIFGVGDIYFNRYNEISYSRKRNQRNMFIFKDIPDFERVYQKAVRLLQEAKLPDGEEESSSRDKFGY